MVAEWKAPSTPHERIGIRIDAIFRRMRVEWGHSPDIRDLIDDLEPIIRMEITLAKFEEEQLVDDWTGRRARIRELVIEMAEALTDMSE